MSDHILRQGATGGELANRAAHLNALVKIGASDLVLFASDGSVLESSAILRIPFSTPLSIEYLMELFYATEELSYPYKSTTICYDTGASYVLVPHDLSGSTVDKEWLACVTNMGEQQLMRSELQQERMDIHYSIPQDIYDFCLRSFSLARFEHLLQSFVATLTTYTRRVTAQALMVHWQDDHADLLLAQGGVLLLVNRYKIRSEIDLLYYITSVWRHFALSQATDHLLLYLPSDRRAAFLKMIEGQFEHLVEGYLPPISEGMQDLLQHYPALPHDMKLRLLCE